MASSVSLTEHLSRESTGRIPRALENEHGFSLLKPNDLSNAIVDIVQTHRLTVHRPNHHLYLPDLKSSKTGSYHLASFLARN